MPMKMIQGDLAWKTGASWDTGPPINAGSQVVIEMLNGYGSTLYTGDVVIAGTGITNQPDPTAVKDAPTTTAASPYTVGVVGGLTNQPGDGSFIPSYDTTQRVDAACTTSTGGTTVSDAAVLASDVGQGVSGPGIPLGAYIMSVVAGTSFLMSVPATAFGTVALTIGPRNSSVGPGYLAVPPGDVMPVVIAGLAYVNIGQAAMAAGNVLSTGTSVRIAVTAGTPTMGTNIGIALETHNTGVFSGDGTNNKLVRAWITKV